MNFDRKPVLLWQRLLVALLIVGAASAFRLVFFGSLGRGIPNLVFYPAVVLAALYGGLAGGFLATAISVPLSFFWVQQSHLSPPEWMGMAVFVVSCVIVTAVGEGMRRSETRAKLAQGRAEAVSQEFRSEITERKGAEQALQASKEELPAAFDSMTAATKEATRMVTVVRDSNDAITIQDFEGRITAWNHGAELMYGYSEAEAFTKNIDLLTTPDKVAEQKDFIRRLMAGEAVSSFETQRITKDRRVLDVWMTVTKLMDDDGNPIGLASTERDITARKLEEKNLRRFATVVKDSNDAITIQDFEGRITAWNRGAELMYGYSETEAFTKNIDLLTAPGKVDEQKDFIRRLVAGEAVSSFETQRVTKDGRVLDVWMTVTKLMDDAGNPIGLASTERDITARKQAEETLRESEEKYRTLLENAGAGVGYFSAEGRLILFNSMAARYMGGDPADFVGKSVTEIYDRELADTLMRRIAEALRSDVSKIYEDHIQIPAGGMWFLSNYRVVKDLSGRRIGVQVISSDITERKQAEEAQRTSEAHFSTVFRASPLSIAIARIKDGVFVDVNRAWEEVTGFTREEAIGHTGAELNVWGDTGQRERVVAAMYKCGTAKGSEVQVRQKSGTVRDLLMSADQIDFGGEPCTLTMALDVTDRKKSENDLRKGDAEFRAMFDMASIGMAQADTRTQQWLRVNAKMCEITGYSADEMLKMHIAELTYPADRQKDSELFQQVVRGEAPDYRVEKRYLRKDGTVVWVNVNMTVIRDAANQPVRTMATIEDITERMQAEEEKGKLEDQLRQAQKMESVGRLAGGVAHDFNNLLMGTMGYTQLCLDKIGPEHPICEYLEEIMRVTERSAELTRQLLAFARKQIIAPKVIDLNDAISGMLKLLRRLIGEDITMKFTADPDTWPVKVDPVQIDQILANLCVNGRDAIDGVGSIMMETSNATFDEDFCANHPGSRSGKYALLSVADNGCGMDRETLEHIFEPFFTTKGLGEGTGLGLATVYGIVKQNDGFINVYSEPGKGTTFKIYLPRFVDATAVREAVQTPTKPPRGTETVLLVEDEKSVRVTTATFLEDLGYTILVAESPAQALRLVAEHPGEIHLLLTDVIMPGMSGRDLAKRLLELHPTIKRLFISGFTADVIAQRGILDNGMNFLSKPFGRDALARKVREVLEA